MVVGTVEWLGVEWIGDKTPVLEQVGTLGAALLAAVVAIVAAVIAAKTANERQERQLTDALERQREQLDHDTTRQTEALAHDRAMRDRDYLRKEVAMALEKALDVSDMSNRHQTACERAEASQAEVEVLPEHNPLRAPKMAASLEALKLSNLASTELNNKVLEGYSHAVRLRALLGESHPIVTSYLRLIEAQRVLGERVAYSGVPRSSEEKEKASETQETVGPALMQYENACRAEFGT